MRLKLAFRASDGSVTILDNAPKSHLERLFGPMTDEKYMAFVRSQPIMKGVTEVTVLPDDWDPDAVKRAYRDAWTIRDGKVEVDMPKARDVHRRILRFKRERPLRQLDVEYQKADERGDAVAKAQIAAKKQALRDATADPRIEAATTPEELHAINLP
jgi:hypothetical protein